MSCENRNPAQQSWKTLKLLVGGLLLLGCSFPNVATNPLNLDTAPIAPTEVAQAAGQVLPVTAQAQIGAATIQLEVAQTPQQKSLGLMYRSTLPDDRGMLFTFSPPQASKFWMKNCRIALDMVFLRQGQIIDIVVDAPPCLQEPCPLYGPEQAFDQVIELRGGRSTELGLRVGDPIDVEFLAAQAAQSQATR